MGSYLLKGLNDLIWNPNPSWETQIVKTHVNGK